MTTRLTAAGLTALAALMLSGCGVRGDLERPPPLWGPDERSEAERAHENPDAEPAAEDEPGEEPQG